jgi:hypothetical protein
VFCKRPPETETAVRRSDVQPFHFAALVVNPAERDAPRDLFIDRRHPQSASWRRIVTWQSGELRSESLEAKIDAKSVGVFLEQRAHGRQLAWNQHLANQSHDQRLQDASQDFV